MKSILCRVLALVAIFAWVPNASAETEAQRVVDRLLAPPHIKTEPGFEAKLLVPPGQLYDPLFMIEHDGAVWLTDDGPEEGGTGSRIVSVTPDGKISIIVDRDVSVPMVGWGFAPPGFGNFAGQLIVFGQSKVGQEGIVTNHMIERLDPANHYKAMLICTLPNAGDVASGIPGAGADARFGPHGSPFGDRFFANTPLNAMMYQMNGAGECTPFANFSQYGGPIAITFTPDGKQMLATTSMMTRPGDPLSGLKKNAGMIMRVSPDGKIDPEPFAKGFDAPMGMDWAPATFGSHGGELFVADLGDIQAPVPMTQNLVPDGKVYRVSTDGKVELVASGFVNPAGIRFVGNKLWITDINGDFIGGRRELPDGFIVEIEAK